LFERAKAIMEIINIDKRILFIYNKAKLKIVNINSEYYSNNLGIGDWGLGIGDWAQSPIPNPQSPIPII